MSVVDVDYLYEHCIVTRELPDGQYVTEHRYLDVDGDVLAADCSATLRDAYYTHEAYWLALQDRFARLES